MGSSTPCGDSGIQVPSILGLCHPLGHCLSGSELSYGISIFLLVGREKKETQVHLLNLKLEYEF